MPRRRAERQRPGMRVPLACQGELGPVVRGSFAPAGESRSKRHEHLACTPADISYGLATSGPRTCCACAGCSGRTGPPPPTDGRSCTSRTRRSSRTPPSSRAKASTTGLRRWPPPGTGPSTPGPPGCHARDRHPRFVAVVALTAAVAASTLKEEKNT